MPANASNLALALGLLATTGVVSYLNPLRLVMLWRRLGLALAWARYKRRLLGDEELHGVMADSLRDEETESLKTPAIVVKYLRVAKIRFGTPKRTEANRLSVRDYVRKSMEADDTRHIDIARYLDQVVAMAFIPNDVELRWNDAHLSPEAVGRNRHFLRFPQQ